MGKRVLRNYDSNGNLISLECSVCHEVKAVSEFSKDKSKKDGVCTKCKDCYKEYYKRNADKLKEYSAEYRKQNAEYCAEYSAEYYQQNKDKIKEYSAEYYQQNKDKIKEYYAEYRKQNAEYYAEYYKQNADKIKEQQAEYRKQNADKIKEYSAEYYKQNAEYYAEYYNQKVEQSLAEIKVYVEIDPQRYNYNPNEEIYGIIYLVHNVKSDKYYIGQTTTGFDIRYKSGWLYEHSYKDTVKEDLELYGESSFEYTKIFKVAHNQQDLDRLEAYYIDYFNSYENGYNETRGNIFTERK